MFKKKAITAVITYDNGNETKQAKGEVTTQALPIQLTDMVGVERINIIRNGDSIVITAGNDNAVVNIELKEQ
jgi:hypothetical protein